MKHHLPLPRLLLLLLIATARIALCDPRADLASPSQEVRDAAAKILRASPYVPPPSGKWDKLLASLQPGMTKPDVEKILSPLHAGWGGDEGERGVITEWWDLDDFWVLGLEYEGPFGSGKLLGRYLTPQLQPVSVALPDHFTGTWTLYYPNGQPFAKNHYTSGVCDGEGINYFPSGKVHLIKLFKTRDEPELNIEYMENGTVVNPDY